MLKVRISVMNDTFQHDCAAAEWRAKVTLRGLADQALWSTTIDPAAT
jgi:hypothetical protein